VSPEVLVTILGMAAVTFGIRLAGYVLADRLPPTGFVAAWMKHIPGAVLAAIVAPDIATGGWVGALAAVATALAFIATRNLFAAMVAGVGVVYVARTFLGL
jgi:branched-subunit amino acid transport protein